MAENLSRLPNYTCLETVARTVRERSKDEFKPVDTLRFEIAYVSGKEMISWPGEKKFEERPVAELIGRAGAIGNGDFAVQLRNLFQSAGPVFSAPSSEVCGGRKCLHWNFAVPRGASGWTIVTRKKQSVSGYAGSFWVDAESFDLVRLESHATDIPRESGVARNASSIEYTRTEIGGARFLLPAASELRIEDSNGTEHRNLATFSGCRQYVGESKLSFGEPAAAPVAAPSVATTLVHLPAGVAVEATLAQPIQTKSVDVPFSSAAVDEPGPWHYVRTTLTPPPADEGIVLTRANKSAIPAGLRIVLTAVGGG